MRDALEQMLHVDLLVGLLPRLINGLAVLPVGLVAGQCFDPVKQHVLEVLAEMQILLAGQMSILEAESTLTDS